MKKRFVIIYIILVLLLIFSFGLNVVIGSTNLSFTEVFQIITNHDTESVNGTILWDIRIPRTIAAMMLGGALALAGYLLQGLRYTFVSMISTIT